eukprot:m.16772 g.16772  ORF g.16772 m.16772 type:complete len:624 (+) comp27134_c0_seq1:623-2494(+)
MMAVNISVEPFTDTKISEIHPMGGETCVEQESLSEKLTRLAQQIDFGVDVSLLKSSVDEKATAIEKATDGCPEGEEAESKLPWEGVLGKLRQAFTELSVLSDVLNIIKQNRPHPGSSYLAFETVVQEQPRPSPGYQLIAKKRALTEAAHVLLDGARAMMHGLESEKGSSSSSMFHSELMSMRTKWRVRRVGANISGDISYQSVGSDFSQSGHFDVQRNCDSGDSGVSLKVNLPLSLRTCGKIFVFLTQAERLADVPDLSQACDGLLAGTVPDSIPVLPWQRELESAQEYLYAKELFLQICREAGHSPLPVESTISGNALHVQLFPGYWLTVLFHTRDMVDKSQSECCVLPLGVERMIDLELSFHQSLNRIHADRSGEDIPRPTTLSLLQVKKYRQAGYQLISKAELEAPDERNGAFENVIREAQHSHVKHLTLATLEDISRAVSDPNVSFDSSSISSSNQSVIRVRIQSTFNHHHLGVHIQVSVGNFSVHVVSSNGNVGEFLYSDAQRRLKAFIFHEIALYNYAVAAAEVSNAGWQVLKESKHSSVEGHSTVCPSILAANKDGSWAVLMLFLWDPLPIVRVSVSNSRVNGDGGIRTVEFTPINLSEMSGNSFGSQLKKVMLGK